MAALTDSPLTQRLTQSANAIQATSLNQLFSEQPDRGQAFSLSVGSLFCDFSKNWLTPAIFDELIELAHAANLPQAIQDMFAGKCINNTEQRPALHVALREPSCHSLTYQGQRLGDLIEKQFTKMATFVSQVHKGQWLGFSGQPITDVVNLGIGGSDLGPKMVCQALKPFHTGHVHCHFVSNVDGYDLSQTLKGLNPETTLFIVASKSFTTQETLLNATTARAWLLEAYQNNSNAVARHFVAISSKPEKAKAFGIDASNVFEMWDWVGGRYSLWSTIGLPIALSVGMEHFQALLEGAALMDRHFRDTELNHNLPVILGLLSVWYRNFHQLDTHAILPYDQRLAHFPGYLQQAIMESNGKRMNKAGQPVSYGTSGIIWGDVGTNGQHAFHQLLHQGTTIVPADFIITKKPSHSHQDHHDALWANALAQAQALMAGKSLEQAEAELRHQGLSAEQAKHLAPHKVIPGNKPSNFIVLEELTPKSLGSLIALYEHKIYVESVLWDINAFDQWGVELGKQLASPLLKAIESQSMPTEADGSTQQLLMCYLQARK